MVQKLTGKRPRKAGRKHPGFDKRLGGYIPLKLSKGRFEKSWLHH
jgi:hypothetical protein